ncbi:MAG TPA: hypothetical protein VNL71_25075 [Chloroflexota bacterium]|nr:hypothetical protein [Chloroflexota bacterium]
MNLLDENIPEHQRQLLRGWRVLVRQIGVGVGQKGIADDAIIVMLHQLSRPTFFTRDDDFYQKALCHSAYCLVHLAVGQYEVASFVRRFLRHPRFGTHIRRRGAVVRVGHDGLHVWRLNAAAEENIAWPNSALHGGRGG